MPYRKTVSIEIGPDQIRAVELTDGRKKAAVFNVLEFDTPEGCVDNGYITNAEKLGAVLRQNLGDAGILTTDAIFTFIPEDILVGGAEIQTGKRKDFESDVRAKAQELFGLAGPHVKETAEDGSVSTPESDGVSIDDYYIDYIEQDVRSKIANMIIYAAPIELIESYSELAAAAQLEMEAADYIGNSLLQWMNKSFKNDSVMMIDLRGKGSTATSITEGVLRVQVDLNSRTEALNAAVRAHDAASEMEEFADDASGFIYRGEQQIISEAKELVQEINSVAIEFLNENVEEYIDQIVLASEGEGAQILAKQIWTKTGIDTLTLEDLPNRALVKDEAPFGPLNQGDFIAVIGAVMDPLQFRPQETPAEPSRISINARKDLISRVLMIVVVVCLFITAALCVTYFILRSHNKALESNLDKIRYIEDVYKDYQDAEEKNSEIRRLDRSTEEKNELLSQLFSDLESKMPSNSRITSMNSSDDMVTFSVRAGNKESAAQFIMQFRKIDYLSDIEVSDLSDTRDSSQKEAVDFTISAYLTGNVNDDYEKSDGANDDGIDSSRNSTSQSISYTGSSVNSTGTSGTSGRSNSSVLSASSGSDGSSASAGMSGSSGSSVLSSSSGSSGSSDSASQTVSYEAAD